MLACPDTQPLICKAGLVTTPLSAPQILVGQTPRKEIPGRETQGGSEAWPRLPCSWRHARIDPKRPQYPTVRHTWLLILGSLLKNCVPLAKLLHLSELQFPRL